MNLYIIFILKKIYLLKNDQIRTNLRLLLNEFYNYYKVKIYC